MIQQVLGEDRWANAMSPDDLRALSPLLYSQEEAEQRQDNAWTLSENGCSEDARAIER